MQEEIKINLDIDLTGLSNNELAKYVIQLTNAINQAVQTNQYGLMSLLVGYKIKVERLLEENLKKNLKLN